MFFAASALQGALGIPSTKVPINLASFASYVFPPMACYILVAILAVTPRTHIVRIALWPVVAFLAFRAVASVDMSLGDPFRQFLNVDFLISMLSMGANTLSWTIPEKPLIRHLRPVNSSPSAIMDAMDLVTNLRGHGWNWSRGLYVPRETRPANRIAFAFYALVSAIVHGLVYGAVCRAAYVLGGEDAISIFDETLPFFTRYLRSSFISILAALHVYTVLQMGYGAATAIGVLVFRQDPAQWPPVFDKPWRATSVNDFWSRRWHQLFRSMYLLGAYPFSLVFGRAGMIIGAFLTSGLSHHVMMIPLGRNIELWRLMLGFGMMAPGILAERAFYKMTGKKVEGIVGWFWTVTWILLWGNWITDALMRAGLFGCSSSIDSMSPVRALVERSAMDFDAWLHTI